MWIDKIFIGEKIKQFRKKKDLSIAQVAEMVGLSDKHLGRIESGSYVPNSINLFKIMKVLEISPQEFGIDIESPQSAERIELMKLISLSDDKEVCKYLKLIKVLKEE